MVILSADLKLADHRDQILLGYTVAVAFLHKKAFSLKQKRNLLLGIRRNPFVILQIDLAGKQSKVFDLAAVCIDIQPPDAIN